MKRRWHLLAAFAAAFAATPPLLWPNRPLWQCKLPDPGELRGFGADGSTAGADHHTIPDSAFSSTSLVRYDWATGRPLDSISLPVAPENKITNTRLAPGGRYLLAGATHAPDDEFHQHWQTFDSATGEWVGAEVVGFNEPSNRSFSDDGRYYLVKWNFDEADVHERWDLIETATGRSLQSWTRRFADDPDASPEEPTELGPRPRIAPDGRTVAILWSVTQYQSDIPQTVEIIDTASGQILRSVKLSPPPCDGCQGRTHWGLAAWDGTRATLLQKVGFVNMASKFEAYSQDLWRPASNDSLRAEPLRGVWGGWGDDLRTWQSGPGWIAVFVVENHEVPDQLRSYATAWGLASLLPQSEMRCTVYDQSTGRVRGSALVDGNAIISPDGWRIADCDYNTGLRVWDVAPPRRAWAMVTGGSAAGIVLAIGLMRARRAMR